MKLADLTPELFHRALSIYLGLAYADVELPPWARVNTTGLQTPDDVLKLFSTEASPNPGGERQVHYVLRLGNARYPHMKLALMQLQEPGEWFWSVDTHDRAPVPEDSPDWDAWQEVRGQNLGVKEQVEAAWRESGVPTCRIVALALPSSRSDGSGPLILCVDDEQGMRAVAVNILERADYRVVEAGSGEEALRLFQERRPALVLMDYEMPEMDGVEVCRRIREMERGSDHSTPVLLATAGQMVLSDVPEADGFLMKPYHRTLLLSFVAHQLPGKKEGSGDGSLSDGPEFASS